ncbi:OadG family protein [Catenisphaera adipataccumulans]|jgi:oxaloacetate decarboxylase gamma subunit|uniref:Na+-transporting methylmalonyl-CoA/oxaloacetate decarboxylase gamma subunit n=1 Tax=Catenisphaera adipataccumulans TaxID=700500 RepID=A0A7W8CXR9_9FIRM|nr:OadG family protein [Catenisphaera adipataccumulans]MBB5183567.1 Na+-transporting methylmalonyl-CoA/oxaloacetate decarboxylase gamma subunit [Catenisphaera adipataccumulans]
MHITQLTTGEGLLVALYGFITVMLMLLALVAVVNFVSWIVRKFEPKKPVSPASYEVLERPAADGKYTGEVSLIDVDEKTAACIMAIVSDETSIPLNQLIFKRIRLIKEGEK